MYMANIVKTCDTLVVRGVTVKILYKWDEKWKCSAQLFASLTQPFRIASRFEEIYRIVVRTLNSTVFNTALRQEEKSS